MTTQPRILRKQSLAVTAILVFIALSQGSGASLTAASRAALRTFDDLRQAVAAGSAARDLHVRVRWTTEARVVDPASTANTFHLISTKPARGTGSPRRVRIHANSLVVVSEDSGGAELGWRVFADPRIVRSEGLGTTAVMNGQTLYYQDIDLLVVIPDFENSVRLRIFRARPLGEAFVLDPLGVVTLR